jgi:uncharacterized protein YndB with AHSA1/START domain
MNEDQEHIKQLVHEAAVLIETNPDRVKQTPISVEHIYDVPVERVWEALTDKEQMKQWYFTLDDFKAERGFSFSFQGQGHKGEQYKHLCMITEVEHLQKLQYSWQYDGYPGYSLLTFTLTDLNGKTKLHLTHLGTETFPQDSPDFARSSFEEGWNYILGTSLPEFLSGVKGKS